MRNPSLSIGVALERRPKMLPLRATFDSINVRVFADNKQLQQIDNSNWQVIFGRRGAGKTTLLATYANYISQNYDRSTRASIELNVTDFLSVINREEIDCNSDAETAQIYFADFLEKICMTLFDVFTGGDQDSKFFKLFLASGKREHIQDLVVALVDSTKSPVATVIGGKHQAVRKETSRTSADRSTKGGASFETGFAQKVVNLGGKVEFSHVRQKEQRKVMEADDSVGLMNFKFNYFKTREIIVSLLDALNINQLYIIIDEWAELDRSASGNVQPYFAELLKKVFWNNDRFVLKIGAVRNQSKLSTKLKEAGQVGLELGADIFELNLDEVYSNRALDKAAFYEELVFKHLSYCNPDLNAFRQAEETGFYGARLIRPVDTFIDYIFKSRKEFNTLIEGAGGLPRDFVEIFDSLARRRDFSVSPPWSMPEVKLVIHEHCVKNKQSEIGDENEAYDVFEKLIRMIQGNRSRIVLVHRNSDSDLLRIIGHFYHKRLLHDVPMLEVPVLIRPKYHMYSADLGLLYDAGDAHFDDGSEADFKVFNSSPSVEKLENYIIR
jgi:hypothetical protein